MTKRLGASKRNTAPSSTACSGRIQVLNCCSGSSACRTRMHWFQSVDSADKKFSSAARSPPKYINMMKDGAVYTVSCGPARCGYPQAVMDRNPSVYITLLTLSDHLRTLAALLEGRPRAGRNLNRQRPREMGAGKGYETHISAQQDQARTHARIPCPHGDKSRAPRHQAPPRKRPRQASALADPGFGRGRPDGKKT